jgi:hypothetical protein
MKLKPIVASMAFLAIGTANAAYHSAPMQVAASNAKVAKLQAELDRNQNPYYAEADWFNRITLSGLVQAYGVIADQDQFSLNGPVRFPTDGSRFMSDIYLSRANVYVDADVNKWTSTHIALNSNGIFGGEATDSYGALYDESAFRKFGIVDEANIVMGNFDESPIYARVGRFYARYGWYQRNVIPATLTQMLTQTQVNGVEIGFADVSGFNGSAAAFRGLRQHITGKTTVNNFTAQLGYGMDQGVWGGAMSVDFIYNMVDVNAISQTVIDNHGGDLYHNNTAPGLSVDLKAHYTQFDFVGSYTTALAKFGSSDLPYETATRRAFPSAFLVGLGYSFPMAGYDSHLGVNYQMSFQTSGVPGQANGIVTGMPEYRVQGDYNVNVWKNTDLQFTVHWDRDTDTPQGTGRNVVAGLIGVSAKFA